MGKCRVFKINEERDKFSFLEIHTCDDGYDYTFYKSDYTEYDGGQLDNPELSIIKAVEELLNDEDIDISKAIPIDYDLFIEKVDSNL